jgi:hypothetical protein
MIRFGQPRRAHYDFARCRTIVRSIVHVDIDDAHVDQRQPPAGRHPRGGLTVVMERIRVEERDRQQRTRFGHAVNR